MRVIAERAGTVIAHGGADCVCMRLRCEYRHFVKRLAMYRYKSFDINKPDLLRQQIIYTRGRNIQIRMRGVAGDIVLH